MRQLHVSARLQSSVQKLEGGLRDPEPARIREDRVAAVPVNSMVLGANTLCRAE